ncbi:MAG: MFS transporter, partial [Rubrivivax sp.]|nr:MFS transporter [Rubrivivax sp.]
MLVSSFASGALITSSGWTWLNLGSLLPIALVGLALLWLATRPRAAAASA